VSGLFHPVVGQVPRPVIRSSQTVRHSSQQDRPCVAVLRPLIAFYGLPTYLFSDRLLTVSAVT
jgi:hypothetical protein